MRIRKASQGYKLYFPISISKRYFVYQIKPTTLTAGMQLLIYIAQSAELKSMSNINQSQKRIDLTNQGSFSINVNAQYKDSFYQYV